MEDFTSPAREVEFEDPLVKVEESLDRKKYECMLCKDGIPHMMVTMSKDGEIHVHAPFENRYLMNQFVEAIIEEQKKNI
jgi:hypothetical protein